MVSTRSSGPADTSSDIDSLPPSSPTSPSAMTRSTPKQQRTSRRTSANGFHHAPTTLTLLWLAVSLPLVAWDTGYVLGRPHTMEGGRLHWPLWAPYKLYGTVDHVYGWKAFNARSGFTGAQALLNVVESVLYAAYLWLWFAGARGNAVSVASGAGGGRKTVVGRAAALAVLVGFSAAVMTLSKTILYGANEYFSGFDSVGHNPPLDLLFLWIIPNGSWLVGSTYMTWSLGNEILDGLCADSSHSKTE